MITTLARRIAREHNRSLVPGDIARTGGFMVFAKDGTFLRSIARDSFDSGPEVRLFRIRAHPVKQTEVQAWLDAG